MRPTKPIGPVYEREEAERLAAEREWTIAPDGAKWRRVVPSPEPRRILEIDVIRQLVTSGVVVVCAGGGGIPVVGGHGGYGGVEAVIDKDLAGALLARSLKADAFLMLTDVDGVYRDWGTPEAQLIRRIAPEDLDPVAVRGGVDGAQGRRREAVRRDRWWVRRDRGARRCGADAGRRGGDDGHAGPRVGGLGGGDPRDGRRRPGRLILTPEPKSAVGAPGALAFAA